MTTKAPSAPQPYSADKRPPIAMLPVVSSQIACAGYDENSTTMAVQFKFGAQAVYHYPGVHPATWQAFQKAESKGKFFKDHIKPLAFTKYPAEPIPAVATAPTGRVAATTASVS